MNRKGFTLIELMIVVAIIAIIAAVAIPGLLRSRIGSHESSAIASLKAVSTGQEQFRNAVAVDVNRNGVGEYGYLDELGGTIACRNGGQTYTASPFIPAVLGTIVAQASALDYSAKSGFNFGLWMNDGAGGAYGTQSADGLTNAEANGAEGAFVAYAWPATQGRSGVRAFGIDTQGQPYAYPNNGAGTLPIYDTSAATPSVPAWDAFYTTTTWAAGINTSEWVPAG